MKDPYTVLLSSKHEGMEEEMETSDNYWVAVKKLKLSYYIGETLLFTIYTHYGNLI